jgi:hypothetical protein
MRPKGAALTEAVRGFADQYDVVFVDMFNDKEIQRRHYWSADRLHLNSAGHRRVASMVLDALGYPTEAHVIDPGPSASRSLLAEARYYREHVLPWIQRRLAGRSSGDDRTGKYLDWVSISSPAVPERS